MMSGSKHVFISYSHDDAAFVDRLYADLVAAGIHIWIDQTGMMPGTPSWEQAVREAIRDASAILLIASPASRQSLSVQGEVSVGRALRVRVIPLWAEGTEWFECVPLDMVSFHYLDVRGERYSSARDRLISLLQHADLQPAPRSTTQRATDVPMSQGHVLVDISQEVTNVSLPVHQMVDSTIYDTVNDFYMSYLWETFPPFTYGIHWMLASRSPGIQRLVAPFTWLAMGGPRSHIDEKAAMTLYQEWGGLPAAAFGMADATQWQVVRLSSGIRPIPLIGLATNNDYVMRVVSDLPRANATAAINAASKLTGFFQVFVKHIAMQGGSHEDEDGSVRVLPSQGMMPGRYPYMFVFTGLDTPYDGKTVVVDTRSPHSHPSWL